MSKRKILPMESRHHSNEVLIPKPTINNFGMHSINLSLNNKSNSTESEKCNISKRTSFSDFDLNTPCQYFKSSFARSLTLGTNDIKSLDFSINLELDNNSSISEELQTLTDYNQYRPSKHSGVKDLTVISNDVTKCSEILNKKSVNICGTTIGNYNNSWLTSQKQECHNLIEENRNVMKNARGIDSEQVDAPVTSTNIEAVILQTQVDTLLWQLKQVEASRKMYRAVMEEVVRFLERCHRKLDLLESNTISRSKSTHQVYQNNLQQQIYNSTSTISPRARSSTNIIDVHNDYISSPISYEEDFEKSSSKITYNNFRDFTWGRSPKRVVPLQIPSVDSEKLSKEAFRLLRTVQNLLKTQEPPLSQTQAPNESLEIPFIQNQKNVPTNFTSTLKSCYNLDVDPAHVTFSRKINTRESHISLRSTTDSSVQSRSSSKNETEEDNYAAIPLINKEIPISSTTTEDESGFSSINSFQDIGIPLESTIMHNFNDSGSASNLNNSILLLDVSNDLSTDTNFLESKNSTLKASQTAITNTIGLPVTNHRRWSSAPVIPPRLTTISSKYSDGSTVLWV